MDNELLEYYTHDFCSMTDRSTDKIKVAEKFSFLHTYPNRQTNIQTDGLTNRQTDSLNYKVDSILQKYSKSYF